MNMVENIGAGAVLLAVFLLALAVLAWIGHRRAVEAWRRRAEVAGQRAAVAEARAERTAALEAELRESRAALAQLSAEQASLEARAAHEAAAAASQIEVLTRLRGEMARDFQDLAATALKESEAAFLERAGALFEKHQISATAEGERRQEALSNLLRPVAETLEKYQRSLSEVEKARAEAYGGLAAEIQNVVRLHGEVRSETAKLVNALRAAPKTRGRWGEHQLRNVMELAGMAPYCDFTVEESFAREDGRLRPDVIIRLPGGRFIVVDAKTSTSAYLDAVEATADSERVEHLRRHALHCRQHMKRLAAKSYHDGLTVTPDFVAMFVPGDNLFAAAMEHDPQLFEDAVAQSVLIVTPTTLIALAKAIAFGWRQEKVAENARQIATTGRELYKRLAVMGEHVCNMGRALERSVQHYNGFVGSLEGSVMPQARRFLELDVEAGAKPLADLPVIETGLREVRRDRDLAFERIDEPVPRPAAAG
jgi:DNA recombination protein RmuC